MSSEYIKLALSAGVVIFFASYGTLYAGLFLMPDYFSDYISPVFNSDESRNVYFYLHPFVLSFALAFFWMRFKQVLRSKSWLRGIEFGLLYALIALVPVMWITYSAVDVSLSMVLTWLLYGTFQACIVGTVFEILSDKRLTQTREL